MNLADNIGWKFVYELPFLLTKDSTLQWFPNRINHRILGTTRLMFKMEIVDNENCSFCIIVLLAKRHIYRCKVRKGLPGLNVFQSELKNYILRQKWYASTSDTIIKFTRKLNSFAPF